MLGIIAIGLSVLGLVILISVIVGIIYFIFFYEEHEGFRD